MRGLYVPPGVAQGFYAVTDLVLQYLVDAAFTGEDEFGIAWNDPRIAIAWPLGDLLPILSGRDLGWGNLDQMDDADLPHFEP
jgi:dTDP-4-dehydrorhamnose 3,5-epimerase